MSARISGSLDLWVSTVAAPLPRPCRSAVLFINMRQHILPGSGSDLLGPWKYRATQATNGTTARRCQSFNSTHRPARFCLAVLPVHALTTVAWYVGWPEKCVLNTRLLITYQYRRR